MIRSKALLPALALAALSALSVSALAQDGGAPAPAGAGKDEPAKAAPAAPAAGGDAEVIASQKPSYPLKTCVVCEAELGAQPVDVVVDGRYAAVCTDECAKKFVAGKGTYFQKIEKAVVAAQKPTYPLKTCVVRGDTLTEAKTRDVVIGTRLAEVCCNNCRKKLLDDPKPYLAKVDTALIEQQSQAYPLKKCVVSGEDMDDPEKLLYGTTLVEFCCKDCKKEFLQDPGKFLPTLEAARVAQDGGGKDKDKAAKDKDKNKEKEKDDKGGHGAGSGG